MIIARIVAVSDPLARASVIAAFSGPGAPAGVIACEANDANVTIRFDADRTAVELIDALAAVSASFVPARARPFTDVRAACAVAARGLGEPALDVTRVIETYLEADAP